MNSQVESRSVIHPPPGGMAGMGVSYKSFLVFELGSGINNCTTDTFSREGFIMATVLQEVLAANETYAASFGDKGKLARRCAHPQPSVGAEEHPDLRLYLRCKEWPPGGGQ